MNRQTSNSLLLVGAILGSLGFVAFAALMAAGDVKVSPVALLAIVIAVAVGIVLFPRFRRHGGAKGAPASAERDPVRRAVEPGSVDVAPGIAAGAAGIQGSSVPVRPPVLVESTGDEPSTQSWKSEKSVTAGLTGPEAPDKASVDISDGGRDAVGTTIGVEPPRLDEAREGGPDDLKRIKGIGPKLEKMLHRMGVFHYDQIAAWNDGEVSWVDENLKGFRGRVSRDGWVDQARRLAAGGKAELPRQAGEGDRT